MKRIVCFAAIWFLGCGNSNSNTNPDGGGPPPPGSDLSVPPNCMPQCSGKMCGDDGCGHTCGSCTATQLCSSNQCIDISGGDPLQVDTASAPHAIHPEVYGLAFASKKTLSDLNIPVNRWGGNSVTLYNWQLDVQNIANDWYFENTANTGSGTYGQPGYVSSSDQFVMDNQASSAATLMTIPTIGWTPKDRVPNHPFTCGFPTEKYPNQQSTDPYDAHCGNGKTSSGQPIKGDPTNDAVAAPPSFEASWAAHLVSTFGAASAGGVRYYQLDNEMMLWNSTHADVWPNPVSSDDVWNATKNYAPVLKSADSSSYILGYTAWSILDLMVSGLDTANNSMADQQAHGGIPLAQWYLRQLAAYEKQNGARIIDCLDVHYYPMGGDGLDNTRSLWDPTYHDPSWVDSFLNAPIQLFPRMQGWVAAEYPGTDICVSEYNFNLNDENNANAALIEADVLGLFGKYGVRLGAYWTTPVDDSGNPNTVYRAFQIYRNYDGQKSHFGDVSVGAASQVAKIAIYAATDSQTSPNTLTVMIINKDTAAQNTSLGIATFTPGATAHVYQVVGNNAPVKQADITLQGTHVPLNLPASSITLVIIPKG